MKAENIKKLIDFTLEVTNGCRFNCTGCFVDKEGNSFPTDEEFSTLSSLIDDLSDHEFRPMNLQIGPTDIMTSYNKDKILTDPRIKNLTKKFLKTAINCAFLDPKEENYADLGKKLNWLLEGGLVKFVIPFEAYHIDNEHYLNKIRKHIQITLDNMPDVTHTKTYLIMNYETTSIYDKEHKKNLSEELILKTHESELLEGFDVGFNLACTRADLRQPENKKLFHDSVMNLKKHFTNAKIKYGDSVDVYELLLHEGKDIDLVYKSGKLYSLPFYLDGLVSFDEEYEIKEEWTFEGVYKSYLDSFLSNSEWALNNKYCSKCQYLPLCAERGVHSLMKIANIEECISPLRGLDDKVIWD